MSKISVVEIEKQKVVGIRKTGKYNLIGQLLPRLYEYAASHGAEFTGPPMFICHEIEVEDVINADMEGNADVEVVFPIKQYIQESSEIKCYELEGGKMAKIIHKGPYEKCQSTYERLYIWIQENEKMVMGPIREAYLNDPNEVGAENAITEIYAPIN
jgi:effector-binding domain-containing protein